MDDEDLAKYPGLYTHENGVWYVRKKVPVDLQHVERRDQIRRSLKTKDFRAAVQRYPIKLAEIIVGFDKLRAELRESGVVMAAHAGNCRLIHERPYRKAFSLLVKGASRGEDRLRSLILLLASNAADRLPWAELGRAIERQPNVDFSEALDLIRHVAEAAGTGPLFRDILGALLLTGGIYDNPDLSDLPTALRHLERQKVVEWVPLQKKERRTGRRYGLTPHYAEVRERMRHGFLPEAADELEVFADEVRARREGSTTNRTTNPKSL